MSNNVTQKNTLRKWLNDNATSLRKNANESNDDFITHSRKKVTDFLKAMGLESHLDCFKEGPHKAYTFFKEEYDSFITHIVTHSSDNRFYCIRERRYNNLTDQESVWLYEYVMNMLHMRGITSDNIYCILTGTRSLLNYPEQKLRNSIRDTKNILDDILDHASCFPTPKKRTYNAPIENCQTDIYPTSGHFYLTREDILVWTTYIHSLLAPFLRYAKLLLSEMSECRLEALNKASIEESKKYDQDTSMLIQRFSDLCTSIYKQKRISLPDTNSPYYSLKPSINKYDKDMNKVFTEAYNSLSEELGIPPEEISNRIQSLSNVPDPISSEALLKEALSDCEDLGHCFGPIVNTVFFDSIKAISNKLSSDES